MAEFVQQRREHLIAEIPGLYNHFKKPVVDEILKKRKTFEYRLMRRGLEKSDFTEYITFLKSVIRKIRNLNRKTAESRTLINQHRNRIISIYRSGVYRLKHDLSLWLEFMKFLSSCKRVSTLRTTMHDALLLHGQRSEELYAFALQCEFEELKSIEKTREIYNDALRVHKYSPNFYLLAFKYELRYSKILTQQMLKSGKEYDANDPALNGSVAKTIFELAVENLNQNSNIFFKMLQEASTYNFADYLSNEIKNYMFSKFSNDPNYWDSLAKNELTNKSTVAPQLKIKKCLDRYDEALTIVDSDEMWDKYLITIFQLTSDTDNTEVYKRNLLRESMLNAHLKNKLKPEHYIQWINKSADSMVNEILNFATERFPDDINILELKMIKLVHTDKQLVYELFKDNANKVSPSIWLVMAECFANEPQMEDIFNMAFGHDSVCGKETKQKLGNNYISWLYKNKSLDEARSVYYQLMTNGNCDVSLCKTMVDIEVEQEKIDIQKIRQHFTLACMQFGKTDYNLWIDLICIEHKYGSPKHVANTYYKASTTLNNDVSDKFVEEYALIAPKFNQF